MLLRKLSLAGFKSFVEPATLHIEPGLTGVVGPNGCGKSNLLEAIRWVMGENSPKSMRSGGMEDVIFAGTATRPPRDFAEVVLHGLTEENDELVVTRRIERGAGSAYRVNGRDVRAKDVALTFADAATGAHSPALVSQGRIAAVIAAKPAERRQMLEEAAGIAGLHVRRRDAENKLRQTEANLARLDDLMAGLDSQMNTLRRQARQAERYKALSARIQVAEARLLFARWRDAARAADAVRDQARKAEAQVIAAQDAAKSALAEQVRTGAALANTREALADRREDANAHGHRMAALSSQLQAAEERLADLDRQHERLESDRSEADQLTRHAAEALRALEQALADGERALLEDEARRPGIARQAEEAERAARQAELTLARAAAEHAGVEADWRVAKSEITQAEDRLARVEREAARLGEQRANLASGDDPESAVLAARAQARQAGEALGEAREALAAMQERKADLSQTRDDTAATLSAAKADLAAVEREWQALRRDREARAKASRGGHGMPIALDRVSAAPGYERALAAVLGRDAKAPMGVPAETLEGRFWTGAKPPPPVPGSLLEQVRDCPDELAARLALVHVAEGDDGRRLAPGEWLVTRSGRLRRWDGFVARGEGAAEAAQLEADNRFAELDRKMPDLRAAAEEAEASTAQAQDDLVTLQRTLVATERDLGQASETERQSLRALDQAEAARERLAARLEELVTAEAELQTRRSAADEEVAAARTRLAALPDPSIGKARVDTAQAANETGRRTMQSAAAALAAHDQGLAVARERVAGQRSDIGSWKARAGDAARRLAGMEQRFEEIAQERTVIAAKPEGLRREIASGDETRRRLSGALAAAEATMAQASQEGGDADAALQAANEALSTARENRAGLAAKAESAESRREEMARLSGDRFQCPPPLLAGRFEFTPADVAGAEEESAANDRLLAERERIGPVNLVAADELARIEAAHGTSAAEQAELAEAVSRLRGSIGNLNREGRERLRAAFEEVDGHFRRLFTRLFEGGQAHLALVDSDDPLQAGLEIYAQPPGKRLQSLTLLSGGEQALTAVALIFALFLTNPAPICVLDEVDAPLDDANIDRFCDLLDAMNRETRTRYLIVTHNAVTMSRMHRLFGVTMVEKGVSRLVSVDLGGAEELLAAE